MFIRLATGVYCAQGIIDFINIMIQPNLLRRKHLFKRRVYLTGRFAPRGRLILISRKEARLFLVKKDFYLPK